MTEPSSDALREAIKDLRGYADALERLEQREVPAAIRLVCAAAERASGPAPAKGDAMTCPECKQETLHEVFGDYETVYRNELGRMQPIVVPDIKRLECAQCHEVILDDVAMSQIEKVRARWAPKLNEPTSEQREWAENLARQLLVNLKEHYDDWIAAQVGYEELIPLIEKALAIREATQSDNRWTDGLRKGRESIIAHLEDETTECPCEWGEKVKMFRAKLRREVVEECAREMCPYCRLDWPMSATGRHTRPNSSETIWCKSVTHPRPSRPTGGRA